MNFNHTSVLLNECIENLNINPDGIYVDATLGGAGHSLEIAKRLSDKGTLICFDQDINAINVAKERLKEHMHKIKIVHNNFVNLKKELLNLQIEKIDGILLDLGVSSHQLDEKDRGFSYMQDAPLDMRMDIRNELDAKYIVNNYSKEQLERIIKIYGEENFARKIAYIIVEQRQIKEIETTKELVDIIRRAIPRKKQVEGSHPAKRTFQAIRIEVNSELDVIDKTILDAVDIMNKNGRICVITFHSLEDRIVKNVFKDLENDCICPSEFPICVCDKEQIVKIISKKPILPSNAELENNSRSKSAKLRVCEKI